MQLFMTKIPFAVDAIHLTRTLRPIFHDTSPFKEFDSRGEYASPMNFQVFLFPDKRFRRQPHSGSGILTLPTQQLADMAFRYFLVKPLRIDGTMILIKHGNKPPRSDVLEEIRLLPYRDPQLLAENKDRLQAFDCDISLNKVQLLWMCRDWVLSPEWDWDSDWSDNLRDYESFKYSLRFVEKTRELVLIKSVRDSSPGEFSIRMRYSHITSIDIDNKRNILFHLSCPPSFNWQAEPDFFLGFLAELQGVDQLPRQKYSISENSRIPFVWSIVRACCRNEQDLDLFVQLAEKVNLTVLQRTYLIEERDRFDLHSQNVIKRWLKTLDWKAAFQCEMLYRNQLVDAKELLDIYQDITELNNSKGTAFTVDVLKQLSILLRRQWERNEEDDNDTVRQEFQNAIKDIETNGGAGEPPTRYSGRRLFSCYHANFSPVGITLSGPFPDVSNRIIRQYIENQDSFLRVSFVDENNLRFEFDPREVRGADYLANHVGGILIKGFELGGRRFEFLGYSQSALKQHTVWFVSPFLHNGERIDSKTIRESISSGWSFELRSRPALYAARLSQAFTATNPTVTVNHREIHYIPDIVRNEYCFSDGNGSVSQELADEVHRALAGQRRRVRISTPSVFQIRIQGSKGVISVDPTLTGRTLLLRDSMKKFEATHHHEIEIARSFDQPVKFYLNRPLIMILSGLGVPDGAFLDLQHTAVQQANDAVKTAKGAYTLLENYGLGSSFALPATIISLNNLGIPFQKQSDNSGFKDSFMDRSLHCAVHHVLREIKFKCRIPVPKCWKLVGIVDVYNELAENEIYAQVIENHGSEPIYLEGEVMISKSPTIHPGDVQIAYAVGRPPSTSHLGKLRNCVVFSQRGNRPLPNQLSGSDLDGDEYDLVPLKSLRPPRTVKPGAYDPVKRLTLDHECTIEDIARFVVNYMTNDVLGVIAIRFLHIADQRGIFHAHCARLAELHSRAVDFPKNGVPVPFNEIPKAPGRGLKPDWYAPEIITHANQVYYYNSTSILGILFRDIKLPVFDLQPASKKRRGRRAYNRRNEEDELLEERMENLSLESMVPEDVVSLALQRKLNPLTELVFDPDVNAAISNLFAEFSSGLEHIAYAYSLSRHSYKRLSEEEILIGTIIAKTSQPRRRQDTISSMREATTELVQRILKDLEGGDGDIPIGTWTNRAWAAWKVSLINTSKGVFGAKCFGFVALRALLECIKALEED